MSRNSQKPISLEVIHKKPET